MPAPVNIVHDQVMNRIGFFCMNSIKDESVFLVEGRKVQLSFSSTRSEIGQYLIKHMGNTNNGMAPPGGLI